MPKPSKILITAQPDNSIFEKQAERIISEFNANIISQIQDLDSIYWDFQIGSETITLHQQTFIGISIFPKNLDNTSTSANELAEKVGFKLKYSGSNYNNWVVLKHGAEIEIGYLLENIIEARQEKGKYIQKKFGDSENSYYGHSHCEICQLTISGEDVAYFGEVHSVCSDCYSQYIIMNDYLDKIEKMSKIVKTNNIS